MNFFIRFFVGYVIVTTLAVLLGMKLYTDQLVPSVKQSSEEMLVQTANLLAEQVSQQALIGGDKLSASAVRKVYQGYAARRFNASIYGVDMQGPDLRIYVTNAAGIVLFDSRGLDEGKDYSRWRDVFLTLKGEYGARSTQDDEAIKSSSVMYVGAPILNNGKITGVLSVGKPTSSLQRFIDRAKSRTLEAAIWLFIAALLVALLFSIWMTRDLSRLVGYAKDLAEGRLQKIPDTGRSELKRLSEAMNYMREQLDGKAHVEKFAQLLTHELKSPVAGLQGALELLEDEKDGKNRQRLISNLQQESSRLNKIIDGVLTLARAENLIQPQHIEALDLSKLMDDVIASRGHTIETKKLALVTQYQIADMYMGDAFMLRQAMANLLDNAIDFSQKHGEINVRISQQLSAFEITVRDRGTGIPDYALPRLFERFYSVPRPNTPSSLPMRGTGLGLNFVQEVARLHNGVIKLENHAEGGAIAILTLHEP
ncbi:MAG TPA: two-component system sensor histidine kinase CreC [Methylotenera sp.]|nr:two-component system sensor histidine kinase CreC [Methylotenera sp.]